MWDSDAACRVAGRKLPLCGYIAAISLSGGPSGIELPMICVPKEIATQNDEAGHQESSR